VNLRLKEMVKKMAEIKGILRTLSLTAGNFPAGPAWEGLKEIH
jgi:hypothetical protein|tara:strand:+ start:269 stop:397 length:129 start_codon:yes stop_codon:yes gene_type:complete